MMIEEQPRNEEWAVYFDGNFWGHGEHARAGKEIPVGEQFSWGGSVWHIPAVYVCRAGLVIDFCMEVEPERIRAYMDKWRLYSDADGQRYSEAEREQIRDENPLNFSFNTKIVLNGRTMRQSHSGGIPWIPQSCLPDEVPCYDDKEIPALVLKHYRLDPSRGWSIRRVSLPWATKRRPRLSLFTLHLEQEPVRFPGPRFTAPEPGGSFAFTHPIAGTEHTFTVLEYEQGEIDQERFRDDDLEFPCHYTGMVYDISPDIPQDKISIQDCGQGDSPRRKNPADGVIGSSVGLLFARPRGESRAVASSLHFEPVETVEWRMAFHEKTLDDIEKEIHCV